MKKIFKRIMAFVLPVIILIPCIVVFSADTLPNTLYIGSTVVIEDGNVTGPTSDSEAGWNYDEDKNILYLTDANITGATDSTIGTFGIYAIGNLEIRFSGKNSVISSDATEHKGTGIWVSGKLTLGTVEDKGDGTLEVKTSIANSSSVPLVGIEATGGFEITSGEITVENGGTFNTATTGISTSSISSISGETKLIVKTGNVESGWAKPIGILASLNQVSLNGSLSVSDSASVVITSGTSTRFSTGIFGDIDVSGNASVKAESLKVGSGSYGIEGKITISDSAHVIAKSNESAIYTTASGGGVDISQDSYYWRESESDNLTKSGTQPYDYSIDDTYVEVYAHSHNYPSDYIHDHENHWQVCTGTTIDEQPYDCPIEHTVTAHAYDDNGICSCGYSVPFIILEHPQGQDLKYAYQTIPVLTTKIKSFVDESTISYQWYENGELISGANTSIYNVPLGKSVGENTYYCKVSTTATNYELTSDDTDEAIVSINTRDISDGTIEIIGEYSYIRSSMIKPEYIITVDGIDITSYTNDYEIKYTNTSGTATMTLKDAGTYKVIITGKNGFTGSLETTLEIKKAIPDLGTISYSGTVTDKTKPADVTLTRTNTKVPGGLRILDNKLQANKTTYKWEFAPDDEYNYEVLSGTIDIDVLDTTLPTAKIKVADKTWSTFDKDAINHDIFDTKTIAVDITATDDETGSGIKKVEYYLSKGQVYESEKVLPIDGWITLEGQDGKYTFNITESMNVHVYVRVTDNDGNITVINSSGIVKYEDITETPESIKYTKTSTEDVSVEMNLNGNTVNSIKYGETVLIEGQDYKILVSDNGIQNGVSFKADYLDKFAAGEYEFVISYNPQGVETNKVTLNTTTVNLTVEKDMPDYSIPADLEGVYGNKLESINLPTGFTWNDKETVLSKAGENVFKATYTPEDTDSYEVVSDIEVYVNVLPKSITNAKVVLGDTLIYSGKEQTQTIKSVILDNEEVTYKVTGNKATKVGNYELIIEGTENFSGTIKVAYEISPDTSVLDNLTEENVTTEDKKEIEDLKESIENAEATEEEKKEWQDVIDKCDDLLEKIEKLEKIEEEMEEIDKTLDSKEDVTIKDKEAIQDTIDKIDELLKNENVTEEQKKELEEEKEKAEELLDKIEKLEKEEDNKQEDNKQEENNKHEENNEQDEIDDNKNDNISQNKPEDTNNNENINQEINNTNKNNYDNNIKDTIKDIEDELGDLTLETVKPTDKDTVKDIIDKIEELLKDDNLTKNEKIELQQEKEKVEALFNKIVEIQVEEVVDLINKIPDIITEEDKDVIMKAYEAYNILSEEEKDLVDSEPKTKLEEAKETIDSFDNSSNDNALENESSNNVFYYIIGVVVGAIIIISTFIVRRNKRLAN